MKILTREQLVAAEEAEFARGVSAVALMRCAGNAVVEEITRRFSVAKKRVVVLCGNGNNGGDGFCIAGSLAALGADVAVLLPLGAPRTQTAAENYVCAKDLEHLEKFDENADLVVDALFGIGLARPIEGELSRLVEQVNAARAFVVAVDLPSGVYCDGGVEGAAIRADLTVSLTALKPCMVESPSAEYCGRVAVKDIGVPISAWVGETTDPKPLPARPQNSHKGTFGTATLLCGSYGMVGAEILAARAALRCGVGLVRAVVCERNYAPFSSAVPEAVTLPVTMSPMGGPVVTEKQMDNALKGAAALLIGCGLGQSDAARQTVFDALAKTQVPTVLDADGINAVCGNIQFIKETKAPVIVTPHPGEMARLLGVRVADVEQDRVGAATRFARENHCTVVLKGFRTVIAFESGRVLWNMTGCSGLATGGSGDVLSGMLVSLLAQGMSPEAATEAAVYWHGRAAESAAERLGERALLPSDITEELFIMR